MKGFKKPGTCQCGLTLDPSGNCDGSHSKE